MTEQTKYVPTPETLFFDSVISHVAPNKAKKNIGVIVVAHILPDAIPYLNAIDSIFSVDTVFAKQKSVNSTVYETLSERYNIIPAVREKINDVTYITKLLDQSRDGYIFIDIGGYFSEISNALQATLGDEFLGVIEDTENGLIKYLSEIITFPLYHVARSPLKQNEDYLVGQAIAFSAETIFRENGILLNGQRVGIVGYGKVGSGVANAFKAKQSIVYVNDIDPIKITHAYSHGFIPHDKSTLLKNSDILCLASGGNSLVRDDFAKIKNGAYLFTVTSSDDSINTVWLAKNYLVEEISIRVTKYTNGNHNFHLLNNGNAINFIHGTTVSHFILLVQMEIIACLLALSNGERTNSPCELNDSIRKEIARIWLDLFTSKFSH